MSSEVENEGLIGCVFVRSGSNRLPGKCYRLVGGRPSLEVVLRRLRSSVVIDKLVVCTTTLPDDDEVVEIARRNGIAVYRGPENIHERAIACLQLARPAPEYLARLTADNVLIDAQVFDDAFRFMAAEGSDYLKARDVVDGCDFEIVRCRTLAEMPDRYENYLENLDYMTRFLDNPDIVKVSDWRYGGGGGFDFVKYRLTLDYAEDLAVLRDLVDYIGPDATYEEICCYLESQNQFANERYNGRQTPVNPVPRYRSMAGGRA